MTFHRNPETPEPALHAKQHDHGRISPKTGALGGTAPTDRYLELLRAEEVAAGRTPPQQTPETDYFFEARNPDQCVGGWACTRFVCATEAPTKAMRKRVYRQAALWGEEAGFHRIGKNGVGLWKSKYRAFRARMNGGA